MNRIEGRLIRDDTTKRIPLGQEKRTSTWYGRNNIPWLAQGWISELSELDQISPETALTAIALTSTIQRDTIFEIYMAIDCYPGSLRFLFKAFSHRRKLTVFALMSNIFNRGDELLESALPTINLQEQLHTYQLVQNIWEKGAAGMKNHDGSNHRISFKDAFDTER